MATAVSIIYTIKDGENEPSTTEVNVPSSVSVINALAFAIQLGTLMTSLINGAITRISVCYTATLPGSFDFPPAATADKEVGTRVQFRTAGFHYKRMRIPTLLPALFIPGTKNLNQADQNVDAFLTAMTDGITVNGTLVQPCDEREEDITTVTFAVEGYQS